MSVKVKILGENKQKVDEGLGALLDPTVLGSIALGLGVGIPFLKSILGTSERKAIENMSASEAAEYIDILVYGSPEAAKAARKKKEAEDKRREEEIARRIKAAKAAKKNKEAPPIDDQVSLRLGVSDDASAAPKQIPEELVELYGDVVRKIRGNMNIGSEAEYQAASPDLKQEIDEKISSFVLKVKRFEEYAHREDELKRLAKESGQIYENFKRFL